LTSYSFQPSSDDDWSGLEIEFTDVDEAEVKLREAERQRRRRSALGPYLVPDYDTRDRRYPLTRDRSWWQEMTEAGPLAPRASGNGSFLS